MAVLDLGSILQMKSKMSTLTFEDRIETSLPTCTEGRIGTHSPVQTKVWCRLSRTSTKYSRKVPGVTLTSVVQSDDPGTTRTKRDPRPLTYDRPDGSSDRSSPTPVLNPRKDLDDTLHPVDRTEDPVYLRP